MANNKIKISALIPNYNHGHYLPEQIDSMINSDRTPDEIIIIDDASTDNSLQILQMYSERYNFIKVAKNKENKGVEYNINKLILMAEGDYIYLSAADDKVRPELFSEIEKAALLHPDVGVISGLVTLFDKNSVNQGVRMMPVISKSPIYLEPNDVADSFTKFGRWIQISALAMKRTHVLEEGGQDEDIGSFADNFLAMKIALKHGAYFIPCELAYWRITEGSYGSTAGRDVKRLIKYGNVLTNRMRSLKEIGFTDAFVQKFVRHWIYMIMQNMYSNDRYEIAEYIGSEEFALLCSNAKLSKVKILLMKKFTIRRNLRILNLILLYPISWLVRSRLSVFRYTKKLRLHEFR